jgi:hypothetical protein
MAMAMHQEPAPYQPLLRLLDRKQLSEPVEI